MRRPSLLAVCEPEGAVMALHRVARVVRALIPIHITLALAAVAATMHSAPTPARADDSSPGAKPTEGSETAAPATVDEPSAASEVRPREPMWIDAAEKGQVPILAYPPARRDGRAPLFLFLHGMCDAVQNECPSFVQQSTAGAWIACPRANLACDGGGHIWSGDPRVRSATVQAVLDRIRSELDTQIDTRSPTLVGFSLGSFVALDVAQRSRGTFSNLLLIGAKIEPDAKLLQEAGIRSVLLASGDRDMMKWHMVGVASRLQRRGMRASYMSMGDVGHWFSHDMDGWLARAQQWFDSAESEAGSESATAAATARTSE